MRLRKDEEAVSPVIGVILMVAITVILAAVIAAFVFGMGPPKQAPQASLRATDADTSADMVKVEHQGGADITLSDVKFIIDNGTARATITTTDTTRYVAGDVLKIYSVNSTGADLNLNSAAANVTAVTAVGKVDIVVGNEVVVTLVDVPSGQQIAQMRIRA